MRNGPEGLLLVDKGAGPTSHDVVVRIRRALRQPRAGHTGTLDPMATGLLPIALGRATRLIRFLPSAPKVYEGTFVLGLATATDDTTGAVVSRHEGQLPSPAEVAAAAARLLGAGRQRPPDYSARKVAGERLYDLARRGERAEAPSATIVVDRFDLRPSGSATTWEFATAVSSGTYVRALVRDLGVALGCGAALASLRRTAIGPLRVEDAVPVAPAGRLDADLLARFVVPLDGMPLPLPILVVEEPRAIARFLEGNPADAAGRAAEGETCAVADAEGRLLGIGERRGETVRPCVVLGEPERALPAPRSL